MPQPLSTNEFLLTNIVTDGTVSTEPVALAIRRIAQLSPCGTDPGWTDIVLDGGVEMTIATPWATLIPVTREE